MKMFKLLQGLCGAIGPSLWLAAVFTCYIFKRDEKRDASRLVNVERQQTISRIFSCFSSSTLNPLKCFELMLQMCQYNFPYSNYTGLKVPQDPDISSDA